MFAISSEDAKQSHNLKASSRYRYLPLVLLAFVSLLISSYAFVLTRGAETHLIEQEFQRVAQAHLTIQHQEFDRYLARLSSLSQLFAASKTITREEFTTYVESFPPGLASILAMVWVPRVRSEERLSYEEAARKDGFQGFRITERNKQSELVAAGVRDEYFPVFYIEPYAGNERALGFDVASEKTRRETFYRARDTGQVVVASRLLLVQTEELMPGMIAIQPVYRPGAAVDTVPDRRQNLEGFFCAVSIFGSVGRQVFELLDPAYMNLYVFSRSGQQTEQLIAVLPEAAERKSTEQTSDPTALRGGLYGETHYTFGGVKFTWIAKPTPEFFTTRRSILPWLVLGGGLLFVVLILSYIASQIKRLAQIRMFATEQARAKEKLAEANRELEAFVYTVSHDLRSPLTPILGYAELLQDTYKERLDDQALDFLEEIKSAGNKMMTLMEDLLTLAKVGHLERPEEPVDVQEVVQQVRENLASCLATEEVVQKVLKKEARYLITADTEVQIGVLPKLHVPQTLLIQIFDNLIGNAVRYAGKGGGPIEVEGKRSGGRVRLYVRDHGPGIPEEERGRIFEVFYRGSTGKLVSGTGVGLATVRKIARLYGGNAWVEETPGGGATFYVEMED